MRYIAATVRQTGPARESVTLIAGTPAEVEAAGFDLEPDLPDHPTLADLERGRLAHELAMTREKENYFSGAATDGYHV
eukprot:SAG31_NODE_4209_length_3471_cov_1.290629_3_plen_78_part_00